MSNEDVKAARAALAKVEVSSSGVISYDPKDWCISPRIVMSLLSALESREKDAGRYRWLRDSIWYVGPGNFYCDEAGGLQDTDDKNIAHDSLDAAIDAAMNPTQEQQHG